MRDHVKADLLDSILEASETRHRPDTHQSFTETNSEGHRFIASNGPNRHERRTRLSAQKKDFRRLIKTIRQKASEFPNAVQTSVSVVGNDQG